MAKLGVPRYADEVVFPDALMDASGRLRVSNPVTLFDSQNQYNSSPLFWEDALTGSGTATHVPLKSAVNLVVTTDSGDKVIRQTRTYFRYNPSKSQQITMTGVMEPAKDNLRQRYGYFDASNGIFLELNGSTVSFVVRSGVSGSAVDIVANQKDWTIDKMNGAGSSSSENRSGVLLDLTKEQLIIIDFTWLSSGLARVGFFIEDTIIYCHEFKHSNKINVPFMTTANLPMRYEIENTGTTSSSSNMLAICGTVISEGGSDLEGIDFGAGLGSTGLSVTTRVPVFSLRHALLNNSIENRGQSIIQDLDLLVEGQDVFFELVYGGSLTGASFGAVGGNSMMEIDTSASAISGGDSAIVLYVAVGSGKEAGVSSKAIRTKRRLGLNIAGDTADIVTLVATKAATIGQAIVFAGCSWIEFY